MRLLRLQHAYIYLYVYLSYIKNRDWHFLTLFLFLPVTKGCNFKETCQARGIVRELLLMSGDLVARGFQNEARLVPVKFDLHLNLSWNSEISSFRQPYLGHPDWGHNPPILVFCNFYS